MQNPIPPQTFFGHISKVKNIWTEKYVDSFNSIILISGKANDGNEKTVAIVSWLLAGFNLADTILAFSKEALIIYASQRKINFLSSLKDHPDFKKFNITFFTKQQDNFAAFQKIWDQVHGDNSNPKVGILLKDSKMGAVAEQFVKFLSDKACQQVQASQIFADCTVCKDAEEIENLKKSGKVTAYFQQKFISEIETIIDNGKNVKHSDITKKITAIVTAQPQLKKCAVKLSSHKLAKDYIDIGSGINLQSGGKYSSKLFQETNDNFLKSDCILAGMGTLYRSYNTYVARTLLIEPNQEQKQIYKKIEVLQKIIIQNLKPGVKISSIYKKAEQYVKDSLSNLTFPKMLGFGIGIFICQNDLTITQTNDRAIVQGNCFLINCTFPQIKYQTKKNGTKTFAVQLIDTVVVTQKGQEILTNDVSKNLNDISYSLGDEQQQSKPKKEHKQRGPSTHENAEITTRRRRKQEATLQKFKLQKERNEHQMSLKKIKLDQLKTRLNQNFSGGFKKQKTIECAKINCYKNKEQLPKELKKDQIYVDNKNNAILFPINGKHIPFSVKILKSVVKNDQGKFASIRFNFHLPGALPTLVFPKINQTTIFVKEMTFRSQHIERISDLQKQVKILQRKVRMETDQKHAKQDIVEQEKINLNKGKRPMLRQLFARPGIGQKKVKGTLQCHLNGFRYTTVKGQQIDIPFGNIKHAFFQPCQKQIIAAIHFRLQEPMMIGKKKQDDIQFYSEGGPNAEDIGGRGRGGDDSDDQQRQKQARKMLDRQFNAFIKGCDQFSSKYLEFQIPKRNGGFGGTPYRTNSLLQPTKSCLINVTEYPFFVLTMAEVQVAFFQRMYANIKSFDVTFVFKDYENHIRVSSIPINDVEKVKNWLDSCNVIFYDMGKNMNWSKFLGQIRGDFKKFVSDGAWTAWDSDDQQGEEQQLDGDSEFSAQSDELQEQDSEESQQSESDFDEDDEDDSGSQDQELSEEGLSWDELDERAEMEDRQKMKRDMQKKDEIVKKKKK